MGNMRFKVGDRVRIKSLDWYNENKDEFGNVAHFTSKMTQFCGRTVTIIDVDEVQNIYTTVLKKDYFSIESHIAEVMQLNDEMIEGLVKEETSIDLTIKGEEVKERIEIMIPEGYEYVIESGKIIFTKKKKAYPKTYEECCKVLDVCSGETLQYGDLTLSNDYEFDLYKLLENFRKLLICRDAYWKIAGEEMGLGKPWEPDWKDDTTHKFIVHTIGDEIRCGVSLVKNHIFSFPTEEMRDAFYENFKKEINSCKELL